MPIRVLVQRVKKAELLIDNKNEWTTSGDGIIIFIAFFKNTTTEEITNFVNKIFSNSIFRTKAADDKDTRSSTHILVIPQFSLGGKLKSGKIPVQYHSSETPNKAANLYKQFIQEATKAAQLTHDKNNNNIPTYIKFGTFGNRQGLKMETDGPHTHCFDIVIKHKNKSKNQAKESKSDGEKEGEEEEEMKQVLKRLATQDKITHLKSQFSKHDIIEQMEYEAEKEFTKQLNQETEDKEQELEIEEQITSLNRKKLSDMMNKDFELRTQNEDVKQETQKEVLKDEKDVEAALNEYKQLSRKALETQTARQLGPSWDIEIRDYHKKSFEVLMDSIGVKNENIMNDLWMNLVNTVKPKAKIDVKYLAMGNQYKSVDESEVSTPNLHSVPVLNKIDAVIQFIGK